jgi:hypothetical protein
MKLRSYEEKAFAAGRIAMWANLVLRISSMK